MRNGKPSFTRNPVLQEMRWVGHAFMAALFLLAGNAMADRTISEDYTLTADEDWTGYGTVTLAGGVTVDLNGHTLTVRGIAGDGAIVCTSGDTGILCIDSDSNLTNDSVGLFGNLQLLKTGSGTSRRRGSTRVIPAGRKSTAAYSSTIPPVRSDRPAARISLRTGISKARLSRANTRTRPAPSGRQTHTGPATV